jgi:uncharacterized membrane protein YfcA
MWQHLSVGLIFFVCYLVSSVTGFGASVLGLPVLAMIVGLLAAKQSMVVLGVLLYGHLTIRYWSEVDVRELGKILLLALPGLVVGMLVWQFLPERASTATLGLFVLFVAIRGLMTEGPPSALPAWAGRVMLFLGGLVHGAFTTGGPLIVVYCRRALPGRSAFRATLSAMWLLLGLALMTEWTLSRSWEARTFQLSMTGLPFLVGGLVVGEYLHRRVDGRTFATTVHLTLLVTGSVLCWTALR